MGVYKILGMRCHGRFYTGIISQFHQHLVPKGSVDMCIPIVGMVITIWDEVFFKLRVSSDGLVSRKNVFSEYSHCIETHLDMVVEFLDVHISVAFELYIDEEFIEFW